MSFGKLVGTLKMTKVCTKCGESYPATAEYFYRNKTGKDGLRSWCKICMKKYLKFWHKQDRQTLWGHLRRVFINVKDRCNNPNNKWYRRYGGRGIKNKFRNFDDFFAYITKELRITAFEEIKGLQIDRRNNDGNYEPGNIRFITAKANSNNKRNSKRKEML